MNHEEERKTKLNESIANMVGNDIEGSFGPGSFGEH